LARTTPPAAPVGVGAVVVRTVVVAVSVVVVLVVSVVVGAIVVVVVIFVVEVMVVVERERGVPGATDESAGKPSDDALARCSGASLDDEGAYDAYADEEEVGMVARTNGAAGSRLLATKRGARAHGHPPPQPVVQHVVQTFGGGGGGLLGTTTVVVAVVVVVVVVVVVFLRGPTTVVLRSRCSVLAASSAEASDATEDGFDAVDVLDARDAFASADARNAPGALHAAGAIKRLGGENTGTEARAATDAAGASLLGTKRDITAELKPPLKSNRRLMVGRVMLRTGIGLLTNMARALGASPGSKAGSEPGAGRKAQWPLAQRAAEASVGSGTIAWKKVFMMDGVALATAEDVASASSAAGVSAAARRVARDRFMLDDDATTASIASSTRFHWRL
jgi:hypothetical protein